MFRKFLKFLKPILIPLLLVGFLFFLSSISYILYPLQAHAQTLSTTFLGLTTEVQQNLGLAATDFR
ncbi:MAG: hypothetical protein AAB467_05000, partial [Patescibacteria group bacterium]